MTAGLCASSSTPTCPPTSPLGTEPNSQESKSRDPHPVTLQNTGEFHTIDTSQGAWGCGLEKETGVKFQHRSQWRAGPTLSTVLNFPCYLGKCSRDQLTVSAENFLSLIFQRRPHGLSPSWFQDLRPAFSTSFPKNQKSLAQISWGSYLSQHTSGDS